MMRIKLAIVWDPKAWWPIYQRHFYDQPWHTVYLGPICIYWGGWG